MSRDRIEELIVLLEKEAETRRYVPYVTHLVHPGLAVGMMLRQSAGIHWISWPAPKCRYLISFKEERQGSGL